MCLIMCVNINANDLIMGHQRNTKSFLPKNINNIYACKLIKNRRKNGKCDTTDALPCEYIQNIKNQAYFLVYEKRKCFL